MIENPTHVVCDRSSNIVRISITMMLWLPSFIPEQEVIDLTLTQTSDAQSSLLMDGGSLNVFPTSWLRCVSLYVSTACWLLVIWIINGSGHYLFFCLRLLSIPFYRIKVKIPTTATMIVDAAGSSSSEQTENSIQNFEVGAQRTPWTNSRELAVWIEERKRELQEGVSNGVILRLWG